MTNAGKLLKEGVSVEEVAQELEQAIYKRATENLNKVIVDFFNKKILPLTEDERVILRNMKIRGRKAEYIKRTANTGYLQVYSRSGVVGADFANIDIYSHLFQFIKERRRILH